jgi:ATP-dependent exoDNAse (exonuclease V) beta subunit
VQGIFDRVVVTDGGVDLIDYKTDRPNDGGFGRLVEQYRPQLNAYRRALAVMLDTTEDSVRARLLFVGAGECIDV